MNAVRLLVTRPEPEAERTAQILRTHGHEVLLAPLLRMQPLDAAALSGGPWAGLLVTSANAIRALPADRQHALRALPLLAVGDRTAGAARIAGFADVRSAQGNATDLVQLAASTFRGVSARVLYLAGEQRAVDLMAALAAHGIAVETAVVYRMAAVEHLPDEVAKALAAHRIDGVLHYSARSAKAYLAAAAGGGVREAALAPSHYCLSAEIAAPLTAAGATNVHIAGHPDEVALRRLIDWA